MIESQIIYVDWPTLIQEIHSLRKAMHWSVEICFNLFDILQFKIDQAKFQYHSLLETWYIYMGCTCCVFTRISIFIQNNNALFEAFNEYVLFWGFDSITIINCSPDFIQCYENGRLQFFFFKWAIKRRGSLRLYFRVDWEFNEKHSRSNIFSLYFMYEWETTRTTNKSHCLTKKIYLNQNDNNNKNNELQLLKCFIRQANIFRP